MRLIRQKEERLQKLKESVIFRQPERLYDAYLQRLDQLKNQLNSSFRQLYQSYEKEKTLLHQRLLSLNLLGKVERQQEGLKQQHRLLLSGMKSQYDSQIARFEKAQDALLSLDTSRIVARGYAIVKDKDRILASSQEVKKGDQLTIQMRDGRLEVEVEDVKQEENI